VILERFGAGEIRSYVRNAGWSFFGNLSYAVCQWGVLIVLAQTADPSVLGEYSLALAITTPIVLFSMLALRKVQVSDVRSDYSFFHYLKLRVITSILAIGFVGVAALLITTSTRLWLVIVIVGVAKCLDAVSDVYQGLFQSCDDLSTVGKSFSINGFLTLLFCATAAVVADDLIWVAAASAVASGSVLIFYLLPKSRPITNSTIANIEHLSLRLKHLLPLAQKALPLGIAALLVALRSNIPKYELQYFATSTDLGVFAALSYLLVAGNTIVSALAQAALPRLSRLHYAAESTMFLDFTLSLIIFSSLLVLIALMLSKLIGQSVIRLMYGDVYAQHVDVLMILVLSCLFSFASWILDYAIVAAQQFRQQLILQIFVLIMTCLISTIAISRWQLRGAAFAVLVVAAIEAALRAAFFWRILVSLRVRQHEVLSNVAD